MSTLELPVATLRVPMRATGAALALSGVLLGTLTPFHPTILGGRDIAEVVNATTAWRAIHASLVVSAICNVFGAAGIVAAHRGRLGRFGQVALAVTVVGCVATAYVMFLEAVAFPVVAADAPALLRDLLEPDGPLASSPMALALAAPLVGFPFGFVALGIAAARDVHARAGVVLAVAAGAFAIFEGAFVPVLGVMSTVAFASALAWWGSLLWRTRDA